MKNLLLVVFAATFICACGDVKKTTKGADTLKKDTVKVDSVKKATK